MIGVVHLRRVLTAPALVAALVTGGAVDDRVERLASAVSVPGWATGVAVLPRPSVDHALGSVHTSVDLAENATGPDLAALVVRMPALARSAGLGDVAEYRRLNFVTASGARLGIRWRGPVDVEAVRQGLARWLARAVEDGSADATLDTSGRLTYADGVSA